MSADDRTPDPTLFCLYIGGPRDGMKTADLPEALSGQKLTGMVMKIPLSQPALFSLFAVYVCTSETQVDGFWRVEFRGMEGPNGERLVAGATSAEEIDRPDGEAPADDVVISIADRFVLQQSWWLASEIARRHGGLQISRVGDDRFHGILLVHEGPTGRRIQFDLTAGASWKNGAGDIERLSWLDVFAAANPHEAVKRLERASDFGVPASAAPTNLRTIVYRVAAGLLAAKLDDKYSWQVVPTPIATGGEEFEESLRLLSRFPSTAAQVEHAFSDMGELYEHATPLGKTPYWHETFWAVLRDLEPVMILDEAGYAHLGGGITLNLLRLYRGLGRNIAAVVGVLLMDPNTALAIAQEEEVDEV